MKKATAKFFIPLAIALVLWGCLEQIGDLNKIKDYTWNPEIALPISNSTFGLVEFLEDNEVEDFIEVDPDGLIVLTYKDEFQSDNASSYIEIPDETFNESISFDLPLWIEIPLPVEFEVTKTESFNINLDNEEGDEIDSALMKSGSIQLDLTANFPTSGEISIIFYSALENGQPIQRNYSWTFSGQQPVLNISNTIDLSSFKLDLTEGGTTTNSFQFDVSVTLIYEGQAVLPSNSVDLSVTILDAEFDSAFGKIASRTISSDKETIQLDIFESLLEGSFYLDEPKISLEFGNSFGLPIGVDLGTLTFSNGTESKKLTGSITSLQVIDAPDINEVGETIYSTITIDHTNSNLPDLISLLPTEITYQLDGIINPDALNQRSFVLGKSAVGIGLNIELPLFGRISDLKIEQEFDLNGPDIFDNINFALLKITIENGFPLGAEMQVFFLDEFGQTLDVLIDGDQNLISAADVDSNGFVTVPATKVTEFEIDKTKIDAIENTQKLLLEVSFSTTDDGNVSVKMLDSYEMMIKMGIQTEFNITIDL